MVETIVTTFVEVVTGIVGGIGEGVSDLFTTIFMTGEGASQTVSPLGVFILAMAGIGVGMFVFRYVLGLIRNRG